MSDETGETIKIVSVRGWRSKSVLSRYTIQLIVKNASSSEVHVGTLNCKQVNKDGTVKDCSFFFGAHLGEGETSKSQQGFSERIDHIEFLSVDNEIPVRGVLRKTFFLGWKLKDS